MSDTHYNLVICMVYKDKEKSTRFDNLEKKNAIVKSINDCVDQKEKYLF